MQTYEVIDIRIRQRSQMSWVAEYRWWNGIEWKWIFLWGPKRSCEAVRSGVDRAWPPGQVEWAENGLDGTLTRPVPFRKNAKI